MKTITLHGSHWDYDVPMDIVETCALLLTEGRGRISIIRWLRQSYSLEIAHLTVKAAQKMVDNDLEWDDDFEIGRVAI